MSTETQDLLATLVQRSLGILSEVHAIEQRIQSLQTEIRIAGLLGAQSRQNDEAPLSAPQRPRV